MEKQENRQLLEEFLNMPIRSGDGVFEKFRSLPGAVWDSSGKPFERYVYIPGTREDCVLLVAHGDTVWDEHYNRNGENTVVFEDGVFRGTNPVCGIGADDRAGCAMLWALRDSGHSLLLTDGEEHGKLGVKYLRKSNPRLYRELNRHRFMLALDWQGTGGCLYNQVDNTDSFKGYIASTLGFREDSAKGGCDLQFLCRRVCGTNIGVGYHNYHRPDEYLVLAQWENTLSCLRAFLEKSHPRFPVSLPRRCVTTLGRCRRGVEKVLKKLKILPQTK